MKKLLAVLLVLCLLPWVYAEDIDLSGLSFEELRALQNRIAEEIVSRPEWKMVSVPPGIYKIGVDIPAGDWCIKCGKSEYGFVSLIYNDEINEAGTKVETLRNEFYGMIYENGDDKHMEFLNVKLIAGYYLQIDLGQAIFTPPVRIDLGF